MVGFVLAEILAKKLSLQLFFFQAEKKKQQ